RSGILQSLGIGERRNSGQAFGGGDETNSAGVSGRYFGGRTGGKYLSNGHRCGRERCHLCGENPRGFIGSQRSQSLGGIGQPAKRRSAERGANRRGFDPRLFIVAGPASVVNYLVVRFCTNRERFCELGALRVKTRNLKLVC